MTKKLYLYQKQEVSPIEYIAHCQSMLKYFEDDLQKEHSRHTRALNKIEKRIEKYKQQIREAQNLDMDRAKGIK
jgi:hypothetical protein